MTDKHEQARQMAEAALREQAAGNDERADALLDQAMETDPEGVEDVLQETGANAAADARDAGTDREVARVTREVQPKADAPSRAGITGSGSGADGM